MTDADLFCIWIAEIFPLCATLVALIYGLMHFFKRGKPLCMQSITMAMACHALGSAYHLCRTLTSDAIIEGFTPAYLGRIGFFLFIVTAAYSHLDRIVDDGSKPMRPVRILSLAAPVVALLLYIPNLLAEDVSLATKITYALVWLPAAVGAYFSFKHAIIPDCDFGFIKAIRPYNFLVLALCFAELLCLTAWVFYEPVFMAVTSVLFGVLCILTMLAAKKGVEQWTV